MANLLGVGRATISDWENGKSEPQVTEFVRWARFTGQSLEWLVADVPRDDETPVVNDEGFNAVRPEGFEPPTF